MSNSPELDRFIKNPDLLSDLCREVVSRLDLETPEDRADTTLPEMEAQLREISKTIDRLERINVAIPDVLRAEKTRLAAALAAKSEATEALERLVDSLGNLLRDLRIRLQRRKPQLTFVGVSTERVSGDRLSRSDLRDSILRGLRSLGGSAPKERVLEAVEADLQGKFLPADLVWLSQSNKFSWQNAAKHVRSEMVKEGLLRHDSPKGVWELAEAER